MVLEDRERIARDLPDVVIQRLFATGMQLQGAVARGRHGSEHGPGGVVNMGERAHDLGGAFEVANGADGTGTVVTWRVPLTG